MPKDKFGRQTNSSIGDFEQRKIQTTGRVDIPEDFLDVLDVDVGDNCLVYCHKDAILISEKDLEKVTEIKSVMDGVGEDG